MFVFTIYLISFHIIQHVLYADDVKLSSELIIQIYGSSQWLKCKIIGGGMLHSGLGPLTMAVCLSLAL